ncbi:transcriptional regulator [Chitiniphilus shinanonensis]|uniref:Transcriptional regulator n=1 Tax=Chitiniphilus shinanonensis TaxID=553088 RepID=A0ABQ6BSP9_9NEIS|nr:sigma-54-dependent transcriptional regulator [Chitiniphilus shinanonensis]GLS05025.1 transcriptional regulator [Chitiniphilus shinanonensis]
MVARRKDIIHQELERLTRQLGAPALLAGEGIDAGTVGYNLGVARNSVSQDLTALCLEGRVIKIKRRPVLFLDRGAVAELLGVELTSGLNEVRELAELLPATADVPVGDDPFTALIGHDRSLKPAVEKGRAAVLYPPNGLNVMLTGPSGVGKTYFAELMHRFGEHARGSHTPFVYFNCAEYFNNPELLTSHLFGHQQGAFTGAAAAKEGLVAQAEGGYLFLDEVHRLPFEGQEKLFSILDKGVYRRLGASDKEIRSNIRLICATTENIKSTLLRTFLRRIQVVIELPALAARSFDERLEMIVHFFHAESRRTGLALRLAKPLLGQLLCREYEANIGELKSDIQFICARAYAGQFGRRGATLTVDEAHLDGRAAPYDIRTKLILDELVGGDYLSVSPGDVQKLERIALLPLERPDADLFYAYLAEEYTRLQRSNIPANEISLILRKKLQTIFDHKIHHAPVAPLPTLDGVHGLQIEQKIKLLTGFIEGLAGYKMSDTVAGHLRNHLITLLVYVRKGRIPALYSANLIPDAAKVEYDNARLVCRKIEETFLIACPPAESIFMCLLLAELKSQRHAFRLQQDCGVILISHGDTTASSMADYVNRLIGRELVLGINMPFEQSVHDTLALFLKEVTRYQYKKLILAVDLGSLVHFGAVVRKMFKIETLLIRQVTMMGLLEATMDLSYETTDLKALGELLATHGVEYELYDAAGGDEVRVIVLSCVTGLGTSVKIRKMIEDVFDDLLTDRVRLLTLDYAEIEQLERLSGHIGENERLAGIVGSFLPKLPDVPFVSLEELFSEHGAELVMDMLAVGMAADERELMLEKVSMKFISTVTIESIINQISVLNPHRVLQGIEGVFHRICDELDLKPSRNVTLRFMIHCCCMVERIVIDRKPLQMTLPPQAIVNETAFAAIKAAFAPIEAAYNIRLSATEHFYIYELLFK